MSIEFLQRVPPHSRELEEAVLSAILQEPQGCKDCAETLSLSTFYYEAHQCIYDACRRLYNAGIPPDVVAVTSELRERGNLDAAGGESYLYQILAAVPNASAIRAHATILLDKQSLRELISACNDAIARAYEPGVAPMDAFSFIEQRLSSIAKGYDASMIVGLDIALREYIEGYEHRIINGREEMVGPPPLLTGFADWDKYFGGFNRKELSIFTALPGGGKSSLTWFLLQRWAERGKHVITFSTEMSRVALARRAMAAQSGITNRRLKEGYFSDDELERLQATYTYLAPLPLYISDNGRMTVYEVLDAALAYERERRIKIDVLCVDYIQELKWTKREERDSLMEAASVLKAFAKANDCVVIAVSQWSKEGKREAHKEGKTGIANLMGASVENAADCIISLYPQEEEGLPSSRRTIKVSMDKNRDGAVGSIRLILDAPTQKWENDVAEPTAKQVEL